MKQGLKSLLENLGSKHGIWQAFSDFVQIQALLISNMCDPLHVEERRKAYLDIIKKYDDKARETLSQASLVFGEEIEKNFNEKNPRDILGPLFHELNLHNEQTGQFFTPNSIADFLSMVAVGEDEKEIKENGYITICEPACGSGVMLLSFAGAMSKKGYDPKTQMVATAIDIDLTCVCMTYVQLSLYGIPAVVIHGNALAVKEWSRWYTPIYILDNWLWIVKCGLTNERNPTDEVLKRILNPTYGIIRELLESENDITKEKENKICAIPDKEDKKKVVVEYHTAKNGQLSLF